MSPPKLEEMRLGETAQAVDLTTSVENRQAAVALTRQANDAVEIFSRTLDAPVYDHIDFLEALKALIIANRRARIRILVHDTTRAARHEHRLLALSSRLSSFFEIRIPARQHADFNKAFLIADAMGYLFREQADRYEGVANFRGPGEARYLLNEFDKMWEVAEEDPNLRQLRI